MSEEPVWVRTCRECRVYLYGPTGEIVTDGADNRITLAMYNESPPCDSCPKHTDNSDRHPLDDAADLFAQPWFWDVQELFRECRAVGDFGTPDPLMRAVFAEIDRAERAAAERRQAAGVANAVAGIFKGRR